MNTKLTFAMLAAMTLGLAACGDSDQGEPTEQTTTSKTSAAEQTGGGMLDAAQEQMQAAKESATKAGDQAAAAVATAAQAMGEKGDEMADAIGERSAQMGDAAADKARAMIASVQDYLAANDLDSARGIIDKLNQIKDSLPETLKTEIEALTAKIASMTGGDSAG
jgi:DNA anti-recombination protein RmuC